MHETILLPSLGTVQGQPGLENRGENSVIIGQERNLSQKRNCGGLDKAAVFQAESHLTRVTPSSAAELVAPGIKHH